MSEYQYYEFIAVDRPLNERQVGELRALSTRAEVTRTRFMNTYDWGDFRGSPTKLVEKYFDAFLYLANWGTRRLMLRLPCAALGVKAAARYCAGDSASARAKGGHLILELVSEDEEGDWEHDGEGWLSSIISLRADLLRGDMRGLYLAWLLCAQAGELADDALEPPVPPNLATLTASLKSLSDFLRIDEDLIAVSVEQSANAGAGRSNRAHAGARRTVAELLAAADARCEKRRQRAAAREARRERDAVIARKKYLNALGRREEKAWQQVDALIRTMKPTGYDEAVRVLCDLRDLGTQKGTSEMAGERILRLRRTHATKLSLLRRLDRAQLPARAL